MKNQRGGGKGGDHGDVLEAERPTAKSASGPAGGPAKARGGPAGGSARSTSGGAEGKAKGGGKARGAKDQDTGKVRGGLAETVTPDATLAKVIGGAASTRAEVTRRIWAYVKQHKLQDKDDGRVIHADAALKAVFGGKDRVTMFEMTKLVNQHVS